MSLAFKTNKVLSIVLFAFIAILAKVWHLEVIQRDEKLKESQKPQQRTTLVKADRGTIYDRFNIPLAVNKICYNAAIYYNQIAEIPSLVWRSDGSGKQIKTYARKEYIRDLSKCLANILNLDPVRVEDLIHSQASLFPHVPFIIKNCLSEEEYYKLKISEKDWPGLHAEISSSRYYPKGKVACEIIGSMGSISAKQYTKIYEQMAELQRQLDLSDGLDMQAIYELEELKEKAYAINDLVGKTGVEATFEKTLRGYFGKRCYEVDPKGRFLREIPGSKDPINGKKIILTISSELQEFAESLLSQDEKTRDGRSTIIAQDKTKKTQKQPWIKGGAIVALDPKTGEILALASHPRFDPNDFITHSNFSNHEQKQKNVCRWLENDQFIGSVWDGHDTLIRERGKTFQEEVQKCTWDFYLDQILPFDSPLRSFFSKVDTVYNFIQLQEDYEAMLYYSKNHLETPGDIQRRLDHLLGSLAPQDKPFAVDICRVAIYAPSFTDDLIEKVGKMKIQTYRELCQAFLKLEKKIKEEEQKSFHTSVFRQWREENQKEFLNEKRQFEKNHQMYARPYLDYIDQKEKELFSEFWIEHRLELIANHIHLEPILDEACKKFPLETKMELFRTFRSFSELSRPLLAKYKLLRNRKKEQTEKDLAAAFYPIGGYGFSRSFAFQASVPQGSIFKLVTGYEALRQNKQLTLIDQWSPQAVAFNTNMTPYPRFYKGGRLPKSSNPNVGKIDLISALEQTSNPYFSILAGDFFEKPEDLAQAASLFGFGEKTGIELPKEAKGNIPKDLKTNRTGLYSTAIGQHTLLTTPLQTSMMISAIANGGKLLKPKIIKEEIGYTPDRNPLKSFENESYLYKQELEKLGIYFPLFTAANPSIFSPKTLQSETQIKKNLPMTSKMRSTLLEGMDRAVWGQKGSARASAIKALLTNPILMRDYLSLQHQMKGKTGTAEILCNFSVNPSSSSNMYKYIWFGSVAFDSILAEDPEIVVVVFLRFGDAGKEAAPLASQMIHKWREIKKKYSVSPN